MFSDKLLSSKSEKKYALSYSANWFLEGVSGKNQTFRMVLLRRSTWESSSSQARNGGVFLEQIQRINQKQVPKPLELPMKGYTRLRVGVLFPDHLDIKANR